jgi:hypothetical protein
MAPLFDEAEAERFYVALSHLMTVRQLTALDPLDPALDSVAVNQIWSEIVSLLNLMNHDPEMAKNPISEGERIGRLLWKYTVLLLHFRTQCEDEMRGRIRHSRFLVEQLLATNEDPEERDDKRREITFFETVLEYYKELA